MRLAITIVGILLIVGAALIPLLMSPGRANAALLKEGQTAPAFSTEMVVGDQVQPVKLSDFRGKRVILYFYPKDQTPGCTKEACAFRDGYARFQQAGIVVLGCSVQGADAHKAFIKKYSLPFPLLLDPGKKIATAYGAANGIPVLGLDRRITYVIDGNGKIEQVYPRVDPSVHAKEILQALAAKPAPAGKAVNAAPASPPKPAN
ncbi:MAG TPA: peroxiredoxin [Candidatus Binataceae bacterium]|nr:peroxiredoxin [Candidatus Binataceae bacterium]